MSSRVATKGRAQRILRGYAADCWLANWDVVGGQHAGENVVRSRKGRNAVARIDQGGALPFRGLQGRKRAADLETLREWDGFAPGGVNPAYARVFERAGVADADELGHKALRQIAAIRKLGESTHGFRDLAKAVKGVDKADTDRILDLLQRRAALLDSQIAPRVRAAIRARKAARDLPAFEIEYRKEVGEERFKRSLAAAQRRVRDVNAARHGMTDPELVAVWHYTGSGYRPLNSSLRSADPQPRQRVANFKRTLAAATAPLPRTQGRLRPLPQRRRRRDGRPARRPRLRRRHQGAPRRHRGRPRIRARPAHARDAPRRIAAARPLHGACLAVFRPIRPAESAAFPTVPATATDPESGYFWPPTRATTRAESASRPRQSSRRRSPTRSSTRWAHACATCPSRRTPC